MCVNLFFIVMFELSLRIHPSSFTIGTHHVFVIMLKEDDQCSECNINC